MESTLARNLLAPAGVQSHARTSSKTPPPHAPWEQDVVDRRTDAAIAAELLRERRRKRRVRFLLLETVAIALTFATAAAGLSLQFLNEAYTPVFRVLPLVFATVATALPILFFGRSRRGAR
jgi:hypothetical protein